MCKVLAVMYHHKQLLLGRNYLQQVLILLLAVVVQYIILQLVIKQWGYATTNNTGSVTFPVAFNKIPVLVIGTEASYSTGVAEDWTVFNTLTKAGFKCSPYKEPYKRANHWIAVSY